MMKIKGHSYDKDQGTQLRRRLRDTVMMKIKGYSQGSPQDFLKA